MPPSSLLINQLYMNPLTPNTNSAYITSLSMLPIAATQALITITTPTTIAYC